MPTIASSELPVPKNWDEFEDICADLFGRIWNDHNTVRYALLGERQNGVDLRGRLPDGAIVGVQCKRKRQWPVVKLTTKDIDVEVAEAVKFSPSLSEFTIATTALNAAKLQAHVDAITERHKAQGLFSVHLVGWSELCRRITDHPQLVEKHYGFVALSSIGAKIDEIHETTRLVADNLQQWGLPAGASGLGTPPDASDTLRPGLAEALERDFQRRYLQAMQRSMFPELLKTDLLLNLVNELREGTAMAPSAELRRTIFLRAARSRALRNNVREAEEFIAIGAALPGSERELAARARIMEARGDIEGAIRALRDETDADCRSVLLSIIAKHKGDDAALDWLRDQSLSPADLTPNGVMALCQTHLRRQEFATVKQVLAGLSDTQLRKSPYFLFFRGIVRFAAVLSRPEQGVALTGLPLDARQVQPVLPDQQLESELDGTHSDLERFLSASEGLELREAARLAEAYLIWCDLLHPRRRDAALIQLRSDMADPARALSRVQFALAYDADNFDREPLTKYLDKRDALGGLNSDELRAALVLRLHADDPGAIVALIAKHRARFDEGFAKVGIVAIEIQALAKAGDAASAELLLEANRELLGSEGIARLGAEIARAKGADPVAEYKRVYETNKSAETLRLLLGALIEKKEHRAVGLYAEELFALTGNPNDIAAAAQAYANSGDNDNFVRIVEAHPPIKQSDPGIERHYAWQLFYRGRIKEATAAAAELGRDALERDLNLEVAIALETGDWEALARPLAVFADQAPKLNAAALIQAAQLAQASGQGRLRDLIDAAVAKGGDDPNVLVGAYTLVLEEGLDEREQAAHDWFRRALDLSGPDGPVKQFELKDLLSQNAEWSEHTRAIGDAIAGGEMPLLVAAPGLRATLVDVLLGNLVRNAATADSRKRSAMTTFSGRRGAPAQTGAPQRLALDISAAMVLGWLGLLPKVLDAFPEIVVPAGTLHEMFEGRARIRRFQKSRLRRAEQVRDLIARKGLKVVRSTINPQDALAREIGPELTGLIRAAEANGGIVVRAAPVLRLGLEDRRDTDMSAYASVLTDTHTLLRVLQEAGAVNQVTEETAKQYFAVQDKGWPAPPVPRSNHPLYLDSLSLIYLHTVGLLDAIVASFDDVYIDAGAEEDAFALIEHDRHAAEVLRVIDDIRETIQKAYAAGKIVFGPRGSHADENVHTSAMSTIHLLGDLLGSNAVVFDDRALNKEPFATDLKGRRARIITSLDIIEELSARGLLSAAERRKYRHRLRIAGACLVPLDAAEVKSAAQRNSQHLSPEFRAIRDSIDLPRMAEIPLFPAEIPWFMTINSAVKTALVEIWEEEKDPQKAAAMADAVYSIYPIPEDWVACWKGQPPPEWVMAVNRILRTTLALPFELGGDPQALDHYNEWLERTVLEPMRKTAPESYRVMVEYVKNFVLDLRNDEHAQPEPDLARLRPLFVLEKLSQRLRSDVLADGSIISACGFTAKRPAQLTDDIVVIRDELFAAFRDVPDAPVSCQLHDPDGSPVDAIISVNEDGSGTVDIAAKKMRFPWVTLLSSDADERAAELDQFIQRYPLSDTDAARVRVLVARPDYSEHDFFAVAKMLELSPESFTERLADKLRRQQGENRIAPIDILPDDDQYWNHLLPPVDGSAMLADYIGKELHAAWQAGLEANSVRALHVLATTFTAPELVPRSVFKSLNAEAAVAAVDAVSKVEDPFSFVGAFEICADRAAEDQRFVALGDRLLDNLFADTQRLMGACALFGAIFIIATAHFATHEMLQRRPVFWRRLAAAAHASLVVRVCGGNGIDPKGMISWATRLFGDAYFLAVVSDFAVEPQWRPEWILPKILVADLFGRAVGAWRQLPQEASPPSWKERMEKAYSWIVEEQIGAFAQYPSVLQGTRRLHRPTLAEFQDLPEGADSFRALSEDPTVRTLLSISPFIEAFGFPKEATGDVEKVLASIRSAPPDEDDKLTVLALSLLAHIAVLTENAALADGVSEVCLERARRIETQERIFEIVCRLIECTAVIKDGAEAARTLARRLEILAFIIPASEAADGLVSTIEMLKRVQPDLAPLLGRALAGARLGSPRAVA